MIELVLFKDVDHVFKFEQLDQRILPSCVFPVGTLLQKCKIISLSVDEVFLNCHIYFVFHMDITIKGFYTLKLSKLSKLSAITVLLLSNGAIAQKYQSFSGLSYSNTSYSFNKPQNNFHSKSDTNVLFLSSQYFFDERQTLGPLKEFDYINTSSNVSASISRQSTKATSSDYLNASSDSNSNSASLGGEWVTHNVIIGASYSHHQSDGKINEFSYDHSSNYYTATLGYLVSDDFVIRANYDDGGDGDDSFSYSASYNLQLADTDYVGFSYEVDEDFDIHNLSSRYFFGFAEQSYLVIGGDYTFDNSDNFLADDYWGVNVSYYYGDKTSVSVTYSDNDSYSVGASYFINNNYSVHAGYNGISNDKNQRDWDADSYYLSFSAQF